MAMEKAASTMKFEVEKFDGRSNFGLWQVKVRNLLIQQGLHKALKGKSAKAASTTDEDWAEFDLKAVSTIQLCLADEVLYNVLECDSATKLWEKLETLYMGKSLTNRLFLKQQLYKLSMKEDTSIHEHLNLFNGLVHQLLNIGVKVEEEDKALILLASLPSYFDHLVTTLLYGRKSIKLEDVTSALLSNEMRKKTVDEEYMHKSQNQAMVVREKRPEFVKRDFSSIECLFCKQKGHTMRFCKQLQEKLQELEKLKEKTIEEAAVAVEVKDEVLSSISEGHLSNSWILDSGASFHMCPDRKLFVTYESVNEDPVYTAKEEPCAVVGMGTIKIKMFDGATRTLSGVRHVPELKKNLISLGALESNGCKYSSEGGVINVCKGNRIVIKGKKTRRNLYVLQGDTVQDSKQILSQGGDC